MSIVSRAKNMRRLLGCSRCTLLLLTIGVTTLAFECELCDKDVPSRLAPREYYGEDNLDHKCQAGQYFNRSEKVCKPCLEGTFLTKAMADSGPFTSCQRCQRPDTHEIIVEPCNATKDALIHCETGFYRKVVPNPDYCNCKFLCTACGICGVGTNMYLLYETRACSTFNDTVCCMHNDMLVVDGRCVDKPRTTTTTTTTTTRTATTTTTETDEEERNASQREGTQGNNSASRLSVSRHAFFLLSLLHCVGLHKLHQFVA